MFADITRDDVFMLETQRLWLRWPRAADAPALVRLAGDKSVAEMTARLPHPYASDDADGFVFRARQANATGEGLVLAVALKGKPGELIGVVAAEPGPDGEAVVSYWLGKPFHGRGLATEALDAMLRATFTLSDAPAALAAVQTRNAASRRVLEKHGFVSDPEGKAAFPACAAVPFESFRLDRDDWTVADKTARRRFEGLHAQS